MNSEPTPTDQGDGRTLDATIAVRLFGWTEQEVDNYLDCCTGSHVACQLVVRDMPAYSASWAGAGEVIEAMRRRGSTVAIEDFGERGWAVLFTFPSGHDTGHVLADTIGEAVAKAALLALEESDGH
ncbi:MAG TPA: hypothetical protein VEA69_21105 [Tepidisphaeraceae bacterium]|nr:hypothetical protein [Tepidisphaeraceae bacterium]